MGALLFPWNAGYWEDAAETIRNENYGKAQVYDWKTLVKAINDIRKKATTWDDDYKALVDKIKACQKKIKKLREDPDASDELEKQKTELEVCKKAKHTFLKRRETQGYKDLHRNRCRVWLLNSMARNLAFDKKKAEMLNKWRYEFARTIEVTKQSKKNKMDAAVHAAVNTLTLRSITKAELPAGWHKTDDRLRKLDAKLKEIFRSRPDKKPRGKKYEAMPEHDALWIKERLKTWKEALPDKEKTTGYTLHRGQKLKRLEEIIAGEGTKEAGELDEMQARVVRETFALAAEAKQFFIMVDGGPGTGKTKTTNRLAEALGILDMTTAYTGSTGTAATNYVGGYTLHNMMSLGITMPIGQTVKKRYSTTSMRHDIMKRLGGQTAGKIVLVIDEISGLTYDVFGTVEHSLRVLFDSEEPFGGINVVLVGDFDQKLPVQKGGSLAQILVNSVTDKLQYMSGREMRKRNAANSFSLFKKYELKINHRLKDGEDKLRDMLVSMKNTEKPQPITKRFLEKLPQLKQRHARRDKWQFCPIMCTGNATRQRINEFKAIEYGKAKNLPILVFFDELADITETEELEKLSSMVRFKAPIKHYFVQGAPAILTENVKECVHRGLVNGARGTMASLAWDVKDHEDENVKLWYNGDMKGGMEYRVPAPHAVIVKMTKSKEFFPVIRKRRTVEVGASLAYWLGLKSTIHLSSHMVDLAWAFTDYTRSLMTWC